MNDIDTTPKGNEELEEEQVQEETTEETPEGNDEPKEESKKSPAPSQKKFTKRERLEHAKEKIEKQLGELENEEDENRPLTVGEFKRMQKEESRDNAIALAEDSIEDEEERQQVIDILENRITPSGNAEQDLALAVGAVNSIRTQRVAEESQRGQKPNNHASTPGAPGKPEGEEFVPTDEESRFMRAPYNLTKEDIIKARQDAQ